MIKHLLLMKTYKDNFRANDVLEMKPLYLGHFLKRYDEIIDEGVKINPLAKIAQPKRGRAKKGKE